MLQFTHELVGLLGESECQDGVGKYSRQVGKKSFVNGQKTLGFDGFG